MYLRNVLLLSYYFLALLRRHQRKAIGTVAITLSNRGAITALRMMPVRNIAAAAAISTVMVPPTVTQNKHPNRHHSRRRPASGTGLERASLGSLLHLNASDARTPLAAALVRRETHRSGSQTPDPGTKHSMRLLTVAPQ